jgi:hypothetical protein
MDLNGISSAIGQMWPGHYVTADSWVFGFGQTLHYMGLCLLFGIMTVVDLRLLGLFRQIPVKSVLAYLPLALVGFVFMAASGWEFVTSNPSLYITNPAFRMKMYLIALAGINALIFTVFEHRKVALVGPGEEVGSFAKITAGSSLALWIAILFFGRLLQQFTVSVN